MTNLKQGIPLVEKAKNNIELVDLWTLIWDIGTGYVSKGTVAC